MRGRGQNGIQLLIPIITIALVLGFGGLKHAGAATIQVTTALDEFGEEDDSGGCSIREAIQAANLDAGFGGCPAGDEDETDEIFLESGTYELTRSCSRDYEDSNVFGDLDVRSNMNIRGDSSSGTVIEGTCSEDDPFPDRIIQIKPFPGIESAGVEISDITIRGGRHTGGGGGFYIDPGVSLVLSGVVVEDNSSKKGGGIYGHSASITIDGESLIRDNRADGDVERIGASTTDICSGLGGGIMLTGSDATLSISNSSVRDNSARCYGGGIYATNETIVTLDSASVAENRVEGALGERTNIDGTTSTLHFGGGGGIYTTSGRIHLSGGSTVSDNNARYAGGGIFINGRGRLTGNDCIISDNKVTEREEYGTDGDGGGILNYGTLGLERCVVSGNSAPDGGGGLFNSGGMRASTIKNSLFHNNRAERGGGILTYSYGTTEPPAPGLTIERSTISNNYASYSDGWERGNGGGIYSGSNTQTTLRIVNSTISGNNAENRGGSIYHYSGTSLLSHATIIEDITDSGFVGGGGGGIFVKTGDLRAGSSIISNCSGVVITDDYNLFGTVGGCNITGDATGDLYDVNNPLLERASDAEDGLEYDLFFSPSPESPATGAADPERCPETDQRGLNRSLCSPSDPERCDIGAIQYCELSLSEMPEEEEPEETDEDADEESDDEAICIVLDGEDIDGCGGPDDGSGGGSGGSPVDTPGKGAQDTEKKAGTSGLETGAADITTAGCSLSITRPQTGILITTILLIPALLPVFIRRYN